MKKEHKLKILSLLLAIILWYFIVFGKPIEYTLEIPLQVKAPEKNYLWEINPATVTLKFLATRNQIRTLNKEKIKIIIDTSHYPSGIHQIRIPIEKINLPPDIKIKEINPGYVTLVIKRVSVKKVPVKVIFEKRPSSPKIKILIQPSVVTIKGFWEDLQKINTVSTIPVNFEELKKEKRLLIPLSPPDEVIAVEPKKVKIILSNPLQTF